MMRQTILKNVILVILIGLSNSVMANSDSTKIGIQVEIKAAQDCYYSYSLDKVSNSKYSKNNYFSSCAKSTVKLQQEVKNIVSAEFRTDQFTNQEKRLRVFMVVQ